jgi:long-chain fatty acid transport protein
VNRSYAALGLVKHIVPDRLTLGFYALVPLSSLTTAQSFYPDEREALFSDSLHPELYGDRLTSISFVLGAAFKILPQISIGASLSLGLANTASTNTYVRDATNYSTLLLDNSITTQVDLSPTIGFSYKPVTWLRFGGTLHSPEKFTVATTIDATLPSGTTSGATLDNVFDWMPWSVDFGTEADVIQRGKYTMSLTGSLKYAFWSAYVDRVGQSPAIYGNGLGWSDTLSATVGVRHRYGDVRGFIDLGYVPSPVPEQIGRSNYVDNARVMLAAGGDIALQIGRAKIRPGAQFFVNRLIRRDDVKDDALITDELPDGSVFSTTGKPVPGSAGLQTNNPGWPGFASEGWVWGGGITVEVPL